MTFRFVAVSLSVMAVAGVAGAAMAADPVRTGPSPAGRAGVNVESSNRDHIDQDAQSKTNSNSPTNGIGGTGGGRLQTGTYTQNPGTVTNSGGTLTTKGGGTTNNAGGTILNNGTINDKR